MDTQKVTAEYRLSQWGQVIQAQQDSGQNIKDFCESTGISRNKYFYWQKKLRSEACTELAKTEEAKNIVPSGWMQLEPKQTQGVKEALDIEINGFHITVTSETDTDLLRKACRTLRSL
jgi:putative transposase